MTAYSEALPQVDVVAQGREPCPRGPSDRGRPGRGRKRLSSLMRCLDLAEDGETLKVSVAEGSPPRTDSWLVFDTPAGAFALFARRVAGAWIAWPSDLPSTPPPPLLAALADLEPLLSQIEDLTGCALDVRGLAAEAPPSRARLQLRGPDGALRYDVWFASDDALLAQLPDDIGDAAGSAGLVPVNLWLEGPCAPRLELSQLGLGDLVTVPGRRAALEGPAGRRVEGVFCSDRGVFCAEPAQGEVGASRLETPDLVALGIRTSAVGLECPAWAALGPGAVVSLPPEIADRAVLIASDEVLAEGRVTQVGGVLGLLVERLAPAPE